MLVHGSALAGAGAYFFGLLALMGAVVWADLTAEEQARVGPVLSQRLELIGALAVLGFIGVVVAIRASYLHLVVATGKVAEAVGLLATTDVDRPVEPTGNHDLRAIVRAVNTLVEQRRALRRDVSQQIREARRSVEEERNRLAALMSELTQSVVVCNLDGRILLYNNRARLQVKALSEASGFTGGELIGLGRSIYSVLERNLITHALESIQHRLNKKAGQPQANFVTTTRAGQLLRVQMSPVMAVQEEGTDPGQPEELGDGEERAVTGFILMLDNITRNFESESKRDQMLYTLTEGNRASLANVRAAAEMLDYPELQDALRERFSQVIRDELEAMSERLDRTAHEFADSLKTRWPLEEMLGADLIAAAQRWVESRLKLPTKQEEVDESPS